MQETPSLASRDPYAASVAWYASDDHYFDAAEPTMTIVGWLFSQGQPLYHDPASAERYAHIYGPLAFLAHGAIQRLEERFAVHQAPGNRNVSRDRLLRVPFAPRRRVHHAVPTVSSRG